MSYWLIGICGFSLVGSIWSIVDCEIKVRRYIRNSRRVLEDLAAETDRALDELAKPRDVSK